MSMLRILLLSDIHFIHCEDDENVYRSLETAFIEAMDEIRDSGGVNQILICGDIANKGLDEEYAKAEEFLHDVFEHLECDEKQTQVYVVPGNHDIDREINKEDRLALRSTLLDLSKSDEFICDAKHNNTDTLKLIYSPFRAFHKFANTHSSLDGIAEGIFTEAPNFNDKGFRKEVELGIVDDYIIKLHCLNSALFCDKNDVNDPDNIKYGEHKLHIPKYAYNPDTPRTTVNISMMHHPHKWFYNERELNQEFDKKFKLQIYGHVHTQSIYQADEGTSPVKLQLGSLQPGKGGDSKQYPPVYNILELDIVHGRLTVKVICYSWDGVEFNLDDRFSYEKKIELMKKKDRTANQKKEIAKMKTLIEFSDDVYALRYRFFSSEHIKEVISEINPKAYDDDKDDYVNAMVYFKTIATKKEILEQLGVALTKYGE